MKNVYFLSDAHLGSLAIEHGRMQERRLVRFLDSIKNKAAAVYLLGDMFDFWNEYKYVVPKGYTRFLGKISELTDMGVEVHFFTVIFFFQAEDGIRDVCLSRGLGEENKRQKPRRGKKNGKTRILDYPRRACQLRDCIRLAHRRRPYHKPALCTCAHIQPPAWSKTVRKRRMAQVCKQRRMVYYQRKRTWRQHQRMGEWSENNR